MMVEPCLGMNRNVCVHVNVCVHFYIHIMKGSNYITCYNPYYIILLYVYIYMYCIMSYDVLLYHIQLG